MWFKFYLKLQNIKCSVMKNGRHTFDKLEMTKFYISTRIEMIYPCSELLVSHLILIQSQWINQELISSSTTKIFGELGLR